MSITEKKPLEGLQKEIFDHISQNQLGELKAALSLYNGPIDFTDEHGITPLQHSCYKGQKEAAILFIDRGADVNSSKQEHDYTALHFAALSGNSDLCLILMMAGANPLAINSVGRSPAQMGAFVNSHKAVATINNFVQKSEVEYYTQLNGQQKEPHLPLIMLEGFHKFIIQPNIHPVRVALNLQKNGLYSEQFKTVQKVLEIMTEREMAKRSDINELMAFKYHYLSWIVKEICACREHFQNRKTEGKDAQKSDYVELFAKRVLKQTKEGQMDYLEATIRECVREFPHRECTIFQQVVRQLADRSNELSALTVLKQAINGHRGFQDLTNYCSTCGDEKPDKKCSKCKGVQYCDRECQRLHWFMHKKECCRPTAAVTQVGQPVKPKIDENELSQELNKLLSPIN